MYYQGRWLYQTYGDLPLSALVGVSPTVEAAELKAGGLCPSNWRQGAESGLQGAQKKGAARRRLCKLTGRRQTEWTGPLDAVSHTAQRLMIGKGVRS
jgi:hypothetical protein